MTGSLPGGQPRPFGPDDLDGVSGLRPDELAADTRLARELEAGATRFTVRPSAEFTDRVMAAVVLEPVAAPVRAARTALRHGAVGAFLLSLRDAWRVSVSPAFPMAMRAQAMALVLVVGGLMAGTGAAAAGALGVFDGDPHTPIPSPAVQTLAPTAPPTEAPQEEPSTPGPSASPEPSPSVDAESAEPSDSADPTDGTEPDERSGAVSPTRRPAATQAPTRAPDPTPSPRHETHGNEHTQTPGPSVTPSPSATPPPSTTPSPTHHSD